MSSASDFHLDRFSMLGVRLARVVPRICVKPWIFYLRSVRGCEGGRRVLRTMKWNHKTQNTHWKSKVHCFLRSWLLPGSISCQFSCFVFFHVFYKLEVSQSHCFWVLAPSWTFPNWFRTHLEFFMKTCFLRFPGSFWRHFEKYFEEVLDVYSLVWPETSSVIKNNVFKTWALPPIFIWIDFRCLASDWRGVVPRICVKPWIFYLRSVRGCEGEGECFAPWNETTKHKTHIESRKRIAFCAPGFYRGQFLC